MPLFQPVDPPVFTIRFVLMPFSASSITLAQSTALACSGVRETPARMRARYERTSRLNESSEPYPGALLSHDVSSGNPAAAAELLAIANALSSATRAPLATSCEPDNTG